MAILTTYIATRITLAPQIDEAKKEAEVAKSQVSTLTQQLASVTGDQTYEGSVSDDKDDESGKDSKNSKKSTSSGGVESPWTSSGTYTSGDPVLDSEVKAFCDSHADKSMSQDTALLEIYKAIAWSDYVERDEAQHPSGKNWREQYARMYYEYGCTGNCYEFACFLAFCLQYMGLEDAKAEGVAVELKSGGLGDHGIVYVTNTDGVESICDTARGTDGWMLPAGTYNVQIQDFENAQPA